tara:strand:+ start:127 stop:432 length:306 start_codon:yes stop_codon:yes gene_type:complete
MIHIKINFWEIFKFGLAILAGVFIADVLLIMFLNIYSDEIRINGLLSVCSSIMNKITFTMLPFLALAILLNLISILRKRHLKSSEITSKRDLNEQGFDKQN